MRLREEVHAFVDAKSPYWETASVIQKAPANDLALTLHLLFRLLSVERDRGLTAGLETDRCIAGLYETLTTGEDNVWDDYGRVTTEVMLRTANLLPYIDLKTFYKSKRYVYHVLKRSVEWGDAETVGLILPLWLDAAQQSVDCDLYFDAITLLLGSNNPKLCHIAFHTTIKVLDDSSRHSLQDLLRRDESKLAHLVDTLLVPLRMVYTVPISSLAEWDRTLMMNSEDRLNTVIGYLRVISMLVDNVFFHGHLLAWGHVQQCIDIRLDTWALEGPDAETLRREHSFLLLSIVAAVGTCSHPRCIEAGVHPSATVVKYYALEWQTTMYALQYIQNAPHSQLDANHITRIARYIKLIYRPLQDVPMPLRAAIATKVHRRRRSPLDSALVRLLRALDSVDISLALPERASLAL